MKNTDELEKLLAQWFEDNKNEINNKPHFWNRNKVGLLIKNYLNAIGKWRHKKRGDPEKGWNALQEKKKQKEVEKLLDF